MKLYAVEIRRTIMVVAEDEEEANDIALASEVDDLVVDPDDMDIYECAKASDIPVVWRESIPYGQEGKTCLQVLDSIAEEKDRAYEEDQQDLFDDSFEALDVPDPEDLEDFQLLVEEAARKEKVKP